LAKQCPTGLEDKGEHAIIIPNNTRDIFEKGTSRVYPDDPNSWLWIKPRVCYGVPTEDQKSKLYTFSKKEKTPKIEVGVIIPKTEVPRRIFKTGGNFNEGWDWTSPFLVTADKVDKDTYYLSKEQKEGGVEIGMMLGTADTYLSDFKTGGNVQPETRYEPLAGWIWSHPYLF
jgi:hypothetical protein